MTTLPPSNDNRRAIVRIVGYEIVRIATSMARMHDDDIIEYVIFTAIWVLNTQHLITDKRYAQLKSIPPDTARRPVTMDELRRTTPMPDHILVSYVEQLVEKGIVERTPRGLVVPTAVFTQPEMLDGTNELYGRMMAMVSTMRGAGFSFGEEPEHLAHGTH
ncbi:MAG: hypothetical protein V4514_06135 [Pseudomonadota bacterium]|uniref:hypothetical protein n=1 Tax=Phenylobacterium sp. TaxID=1871053 RepID=UPI0025E7E2E2|nr:hypothetical protein [Phenylobacterium sp.]MBT9470334.1 hypothetical protein [Phenylobacterium sp.]